MMTTRTSRNYLTTADVGRILGECRAQLLGPGHEATPLSADYVRQLVTHSRRTRTTPGRYSGPGKTPMPLPDPGLRQLIWSPKIGETLSDVDRRIRNWYLNERPGQGAGGGPKPKDGDKSAAARQRLAKGSGRTK
jgi:hypothetical protein